MPRERIEQLGIHPGGDHQPFRVEVSWHPELGDYVEIVTVAPDANERLKAWEELQESGVASKPGTSFQFFDGWHVHLNRNEINRLIRVLRRARNAAFGADE
jgi:hypothetical protein